MTNLRELETYLHEHIPLSAAMQVGVREVTAQYVVLGAPLAPNINHRETLFGGSASALAILSAWTLLHTRLVAEGFKTAPCARCAAIEWPGIHDTIAPGFLCAQALGMSGEWRSDCPPPTHGINRAWPIATR